MVYKRVRGLTSERSLPILNLVKHLRGPGFVYAHLIPYHAARVMCRAIPFYARALKKKTIIFFDVDIVVKNKSNVVYRGLYIFRQRVRVITLFPNIFFFLTRTSSSFA